MKRIFAFALILAMFLPTASLANSYRLTSIKVWSGEGPLSSGLGTSVSWVNGEQKLEVTFDNLQAYACWRFDQVGIIDLIATAGIYDQVWWAGPMATINWTNRLSSDHWVGWMANDADKPAWNGNFYFAWNSATVDYRYASATYALLHNQWQESQQLVSAMVKAHPNEHVQLRGECTQDITRDRTMFSVSLKFTI